jgi:hypothetical protein
VSTLPGPIAFLSHALVGYNILLKLLTEDLLSEYRDGVAVDLRHLVSKCCSYCLGICEQVRFVGTLANANVG